MCEEITQRLCCFEKVHLRVSKKQCVCKEGAFPSHIDPFCKLCEFHCPIKYESNNILYDHKMCLLLYPPLKKKRNIPKVYYKK